MKKVKLFVNNNEKSLEVAKTIKEKLEKKNFKIVEEDYEIAIAIGGDGSFLRMIKETAFNEDCIYVGINAGTLGFAQEINLDEIGEFIKSLEQEEIVLVDKYMKDKSYEEPYKKPDYMFI